MYSAVSMSLCSHDYKHKDGRFHYILESLSRSHSMRSRDKRSVTAMELLFKTYNDDTAEDRAQVSKVCNTSEVLNTSNESNVNRNDQGNGSVIPHILTGAPTVDVSGSNYHTGKDETMAETEAIETLFATSDSDLSVDDELSDSGSVDSTKSVSDTKSATQNGTGIPSVIPLASTVAPTSKRSDVLNISCQGSKDSVTKSLISAAESDSTVSKGPSGRSSVRSLKRSADNQSELSKSEDESYNGSAAQNEESSIQSSDNGTAV